jgi:hypothetical protein
MMAGLWGMLGLITVLALVIALLVFTVIHQDGQLSKGHRQVAATQEQLDSLTEDFYDLKSEVQEWVLNGYSGVGVYHDLDEDDPDDGVTEVDWDEDPFADPPARILALGSV